MERLLAVMEKFEAKMMTKLDVSQGKMYAWLEEMKDCRKETSACQEATEAYPEEMEAIPEEIKSVEEHQEVPNEEAEVETDGTLKDRYGDPGRGWVPEAVGRRPQTGDQPCRSYKA